MGGGGHIYKLFLKYGFQHKTLSELRPLLLIFLEVLLLHIFNVQADPEAPAEEAELAARPRRRRQSPPPATGRGRRLGRGGRQPRNAPVSTITSLFD